MVVELNNSVAVKPTVSQEPVGLAEVVADAVAETENAAVEQPQIVDSPAEKTSKGVNLFEAVKKLTPEEQKAFKDWQAETTKKAQTLSEYEKQLQDLDSTVKQYATDPEISAILKARQEKAKAAAMPDFSKMTDEEIFNWTVDQRVNEKMAALENKIESKYGTWYNQTLVEQGNKIMSDFAANKNIPLEEVSELAKYAVSHKVTLEEAYKVAYFDKIPEAAEQKALQDLELKKNANLELGTVPSGASPVVPEKPTIRQAAELAAKQTGLKW